MITKFNDMNAVVSEAINACFKEGYTIDAKESVIDQEKEKDCTFKTVMKRDLDGIECKTIIKLTNNSDDKNKYCKYHKVEFVGDTKWSEEIRTFSCSNDKTKFNSRVNSDNVDNTCKQNTKQWNLEDDYLRGNYKDTVDNIFKCFGLHRVDTDDEVDDSKDKFNDVNKVISDNKMHNCNKQNTCNKCSKTELNDSANNDYSNVDCRKNIKDTYNSKDEYVDKESNVPKQDKDDDVEDSLIKLVRYIFGM